MKKRFQDSLFRYLDYRQFLKDWYIHCQQVGTPISLRNFSQSAGLKSSNYLKLIMDGARNLSKKGALKFAKALKLSKKETEYFRSLVLYNQAFGHREKDACYKEVIRTNALGQLKALQKDQYDYYADWYHSVIRELIASPEFDGSVEWISGKLEPRIPPLKVKKSLGLLERLKFIERDGAKWRQVNTIVSTENEPVSTAIFNYQRDLLSLARRKIAEVPHDQREISSLTIGLPRDKIALMKEQIVRFREEILRIAAEYTAPEEVVFINLQMFPVTKMKGEAIS